MSQRKKPIVVILFFALFAGTTLAQQPPSKRFSPERMVPPSVHVPDSDARQLNSTMPLRKSGPTNLNFSDTPASAFRQPQATRRNQGTRGVQQVAYQQETNQLREKLIPAILKESDIKQPSRPAPGKLQAPKSNVHQLRSMPKSNQNAHGGIVVDKSQFSGHNQQPLQTAESSSRLAPQTPAAISRIPAAQIKDNNNNIQSVAFAQQQTSQQN